MKLSTIILVSQLPDQFIWIACIHHGELVYIDGDHADRSYTLNSVYTGRVTHKSHGIAWIDLKAGTAPPSPLKSEKGAPPLPSVGQSVTVQITREAFPDKPPSVSQKISNIKALPVDHRYLQSLKSPIEAIIYDSAALLTAAKAFCKASRPDLLPFMRLASLKEMPLLQHYGVEDEIESCKHPVVTASNGVSLIFETTACAVTIDVNAPIANQKEANIPITPLLIKHLKWRHISGNVLVDYIDSGVSSSQRQQLTQMLQEGLKNEAPEWKILGWSRLGFLELHRSKRRLPLLLRMP